MKPFRLSLTALSCLSVLSQTAHAEANSTSANAEANVERITVLWQTELSSEEFRAGD